MEVRHTGGKHRHQTMEKTTDSWGVPCVPFPGLQVECTFPTRLIADVGEQAYEVSTLAAGERTRVSWESISWIDECRALAVCES
jgi:hypothetical protein